MITKLDTNHKHTVADLVEAYNQLVDHINSLPAPRDRGPKSERKMTDEDARRVILGDLKDKGTKQAAEELGLSYGQIYSARNGYTFKQILKEAEKTES